LPVGWGPGLGEEHLVEAAAARDLPERAHLDSRLADVDDEHGDALVLGLLGVGPGHDDAVVAVVGARGPDLLALEDPLVAVPGGLHGEAGHVGTGARLREHLAPDGGAPDVVGHEAGLLLAGAELVQHREAHAVRDRERRVGEVPALHLPVEDLLVALRESRPAEVGGVGEAGQAGVGQCCLEVPGSSEALGVLVADGSLPIAAAAAVGLEEGPDAVSEGLLVGRGEVGLFDGVGHAPDRTGRGREVWSPAGRSGGFGACLHLWSPGSGAHLLRPPLSET
jgi:hypothetical protein